MVLQQPCVSSEQANQVQLPAAHAGPGWIVVVAVPWMLQGGGWTTEDWQGYTRAEQSELDSPWLQPPAAWVEPAGWTASRSGSDLTEADQEGWNRGEQKEFFLHGIERFAGASSRLDDFYDTCANTETAHELVAPDDEESAVFCLTPTSSGDEALKDEMGLPSVYVAPFRR